MTDNEIIKALECCIKLSLENCKACPYYALGHGCLTRCFEETIALINRQKAEIEELREIVFMDRSEAIKQLKADAVKEFAERMKEKMEGCARHDFFDKMYYLVGYPLIDNLVKEFTEGGNTAQEVMKKITSKEFKSHPHAFEDMLCDNAKDAMEGG